MPRIDFPPAARPSSKGRYAFFRQTLLALFGILLLWSGVATAAPVRADANASSRFAKGLLWKIEKPGVAPSYLFGTIHSDDPRVTAVPAPVSRALMECKHFVMEVRINGDDLVHMAQAMYFSDGRTLEQVTGKPLYEQVVKALAARGIPAESAEKQKPWAVMMTLSVPSPKTGEFLDLLLEERATREDMTVSGLETMDEQIAVFNDMPLPDQVALLRETVATQGDFDKDLEDLVRAYLARDLATLAELSVKHKPGEEQVYRDVTERLLTRRNARMAERMRPFLDEGGSFVAVGAAHLPGAAGLLNRIEKAGYRVSSVY
jgi:uncharacterized protein YbaP (TraB family)